jgi:BirA family biotin operon repressor/biotin-[acetyl-CoA-carboxylase] ligase
MKPIGYNLKILESVDSTNNYVANQLRSGKIDHGAVILAVEQYAGRGQRMTQWQSRPGENLTMSLYLTEFNLPADRQFHLTTFVSIVLCHFLQKLGVTAEIKWPNDIYVDHKKLAGLLIENQLKGTSISGTIIGIGLNVNQTEFGDLNATSLKLLTGKHFSLEELALTLITVFNEAAVNFDRHDIYRERYLDKLYQRGLEKEYLIGEEIIKGTILGVDPQGKLLLKINEDTRSFDLKEVAFMPQNDL